MFICCSLVYSLFVYNYSKDNIENRMDGACARYIKTKRKKRKMFDALFIHGDSSENIKQTIAAKTDKSKMIINAINGVGSKDRKLLGEGVYKKRVLQLGPLGLRQQYSFFINTLAVLNE